MHQLAESHNALLRDLSHNVTVAESTHARPDLAPTSPRPRPDLAPTSP